MEVQDVPAFSCDSLVRLQQPDMTLSGGGGGPGA